MSLPSKLIMAAVVFIVLTVNTWRTGDLTRRVERIERDDPVLVCHPIEGAAHGERVCTVPGNR